MLRIGLFVFYIAFYPADEAWKTKRVADWTDQETKEILTNSPWAVMTVPTIKKEEKKSHGAMVGFPGVGRRRSNADPAQDSSSSNPSSDTATASLNMRWESALPIREAELKARETNAPAVEENYYGIAVYGLPNKLAKDPKGEGDRLKGQASLKREGQKDLKPSRVDVIERDDGVIAVFLFPRSKEIGAKDGRVEFDALIGQYQISQAFKLDEMIYQGKLEL